MEPGDRAATGSEHGRRWVRSADAQVLLERFFVAGAATFVGTRAYLALTGYPQIGGHGLHIAHLLWGGLLMAIALVMGFAFLGRGLRRWLAIAAGIGFGLFIDELGKFITSDVNYFFQPAIPLIYGVFVILYVVSRQIVSRAAMTPQAALAQALELLQTGAIRGLDADERARAAFLLETAAPSEPLARTLLGALPPPAPTAAARRGPATAAARWYRRAVEARWFIPAIVAIAALQGLTNAGELVSEIWRDPAFGPDDLAIGPVDMAKAAASALAGVLVLVGLVLMPRSRLDGFQWMKRGVLVSLLLAQPLAFYTAQVLAFWGLGLNLLLLAGLDFAIRRELESALLPEADHAPDLLAVQA